MKTLIFILTSIVAINFSSSQERVNIDEDGAIISKTQFQKKWRDKNLNLIRWDSIGKDKIRYQKLKKSRYLKGYFDYKKIKQEIEKTTLIKIPSNHTIIIAYRYNNDLCSYKIDNIWSKSEISRRKKILNPIKRKLKKDSITLIHFFEKGIKLKKKKNQKNEYFFVDKTNFFRENLFLINTLCGSYAAIKPNNQVLIRNGESRADYFSNYLKTENWSLFFK